MELVSREEQIRLVPENFTQSTISNKNIEDRLTETSQDGNILKEYLHLIIPIWLIYTSYSKIDSMLRKRTFGTSWIALTEIERIYCDDFWQLTKHGFSVYHRDREAIGSKFLMKQRKYNDGKWVFSCWKCLRQWIGKFQDSWTNNIIWGAIVL